MAYFLIDLLTLRVSQLSYLVVMWHTLHSCSSFLESGSNLSQATTGAGLLKEYQNVWLLFFYCFRLQKKLSYKINGTSLNTELLLLALQTTWPWSIALTNVLPASKTKSGQ